MPKHPRPPFINDLTYLHAWMIEADRFTANRPWIDPPPRHLIKQHGRPKCPYCWDTGLCPECLGHYPQYCPADCTDGTCTCPAGQARRAAYQQSIRDFRAIGGQP